MLLGIGLGAGALSGFFGIGGGFLIVPGLMLATGMPIINAVGSSLVGVTAFGLTTAANYAVSGLVDWTLALMFVIGGAAGGLIGASAARTLAARKSGGLHVVFASLIVLVACYMLVRTLGIIVSALSARATHQRNETHLIFAAVAEAAQKPGRHGGRAGLVTPRIDMQVCSASSSTATPRGFKTSSMATAICEVRCSCVCRRRA